MNEDLARILSDGHRVLPSLDDESDLAHLRKAEGEIHVGLGNFSDLVDRSILGDTNDAGIYIFAIVESGETDHLAQRILRGPELLHHDLADEYNGRSICVVGSDEPATRITRVPVTLRKSGLTALYLISTGSCISEWPGSSTFVAIPPSEGMRGERMA